MTEKGIWNYHTLGTSPRRESVEEYFDQKRRDDMDCPKCGSSCNRDSVHNGVTMIHGPYGCQCGWSEWPEYDTSDGRSPHRNDGTIDTMGGFTPYRTKRQTP